MFTPSDSLSLFTSIALQLGTVIFYVLSVIIGAWAGLMILLWAQFRIRLVIMGGDRYEHGSYLHRYYNRDERGERYPWEGGSFKSVM